MKRLTALVLALLLLGSLIPFAGAAFTDADKITEEGKAAVDFVSEKGVISGFPDGSFKPADTLTRAQAAKILCVALEGADAANALTKTDTGFTDVPSTHWAAKFIAYCVDKGIVAGVGNNTFDPDGVLTGVAFGKMLLVAYGKAKAEELVGATWAASTQKALRAGNLLAGATAANAPSTRENACCLVYNFLMDKVIAETQPATYKQTKLACTDGSKYRLLGRAEQDASSVILDWSADGIEFTAECAGMIRLTASTTREHRINNLHLRVIVDGVPQERVRFSESEGNTTKNAAFRILPGKHTIRVVKDNAGDFSFDRLLAVTLTCDPASIAPTEPRPKLLEVVGASTACGYGIMPTPNDGVSRGTNNTSSIVKSFGYLIAEELNMDFVSVAKGSLGIVAKEGTYENEYFNLAELYGYQNRYRDVRSLAAKERTETPELYTFPRKADVSVLMISENDASVSSEEWKPATVDFIKMIREKNGADVKIIVLYYNGSKHQTDAEAILAEDPALIGLAIRSNDSGAGGHADGKAHAGWAEQLIPLVKPLIGG